MLAIRLCLLLGGLLIWWPLLIVWLILTTLPHVMNDPTYQRKVIHVHYAPQLPKALNPTEQWLDDLR